MTDLLRDAFEAQRLAVLNRKKRLTLDSAGDEDDNDDKTKGATLDKAKGKGKTRDSADDEDGKGDKGATFDKAKRKGKTRDSADDGDDDKDATFDKAKRKGKTRDSADDGDDDKDGDDKGKTFDKAKGKGKTRDSADDGDDDKDGKDKGTTTDDAGDDDNDDDGKGKTFDKAKRKSKGKGKTRDSADDDDDGDGDDDKDKGTTTDDAGDDDDDDDEDDEDNDDDDGKGKTFDKAKRKGKTRDSADDDGDEDKESVKAATMDSADAFTEQFIVKSALSVVNQWAETDDLDDGETYADRLIALLVGVADENHDGEITDAEQEVLDVALPAVYDYLLTLGVEEEDVAVLLNDWDADIGEKVREQVALALPEGEDEENDAIDAIVFAPEDQDPVFDSATMDAAYKKTVAIRDGKRVKINKRVSGVVKLSSKQKVALRKARAKASSAGAMARRKRSMKKSAAISG